MIEPSLNLLSSELLIEGMTILFDKREQNSSYPPYYQYMRHLPPTPDKGDKNASRVRTRIANLQMKNKICGGECGGEYLSIP